MINDLLYAQMYASVCVSQNDNVEYAFNWINTYDKMSESGLTGWAILGA